MELELTHVTKRFGAQRALDDVSLRVPHGARVALAGPNGSGKSTLLRILMGLLTYEGAVRLDGECPFRHRDRLAHRLAYVPQVAPQLGASVRDVIASIATLRSLDTARVAEGARTLGLELEPIRAKPFRALSGGMKQKLLIAIAIACRASLLILDEPTASLDRAARERFLEMLEREAADATLMLCSHHPGDFERLIDHSVELVEGRLSHDPRHDSRSGFAEHSGLHHPVGGLAEAEGRS